MDFTINQFRSPKDYIAMKFIKNYLFLSLAIVPMQLCMIDSAYATIKTLSDTELGDQTGQAAIYTNYIDPSAAGNFNNLGFFAFGLQGSIALNANIDHLQLGCGGIHGPGCDIDLDQVSVSGGSVGTDATLTNPFIQLAIKNPNSLSTRQLVGFGLGAQNASGTLSVGSNPTPNTPGTVGGTTGGETGINTISGGFQAAAVNLKIPVNVTADGQPASPTNPLLASTFAYIANVKNPPLNPAQVQPVTAGDLTTPDASNTQTATYYQYTSGNRLTGANFGKVQLILPKVDLLGVGGVSTPYTNVTAYATIQPQNLIDIHNLNLASNPLAGLFLSLNSQAILYPQIGTSGVFSFPNTNQTLNADGTLSSTGFNSTGTALTLAQFQAQPGWYLSAPQATIGNANFTTTGTVTLSSTQVTNAATPASVFLPSSNLGQIPIQNCYGGLKFC
jgi:hypothetical protein